MDRIAVRIPNWGKYNPRGDVKRATWFRLEYAVTTSEALFDLTFEERWVFISLLASIVEKATHGEVRCRMDWFTHHYRVSRSAVLSAISKLTENGTLEQLENTNKNNNERVRNEDVTCANVNVTPTNAHVTTRDGTGRDETGRDETDGGGETPPAAAGPPPPDLLLLWNKNCGPLPSARELSRERERDWAARWKVKPDLDYWESVIKRLAASPFCQGENDRGWRANIDFLLRPKTHLKAMEGQYDPGGTLKRRRTAAEDREAMHADLYAMVDRGEA